MKEFLKAKRLEVFIIVVVIAIVGLTYALSQKASAPATSSTNTDQAVQQVPSSTVTYQGEDGRNALELLKVFHRVDTKDTSYGPQIMGIDGLTPDASNSYWAFYVNGSLAQVGADKYITKSTDKIEWKVEKFLTLTP